MIGACGNAAVEQVTTPLAYRKSFYYALFYESFIILCRWRSKLPLLLQVKILVIELFVLVVNYNKQIQFSNIKIKKIKQLVASNAIRTRDINLGKVALYR